jgi:putative hydrolase
LKTWKAHLPHLRSGDWHVHTSFTDGKDTVDAYCERAATLGIPLIAFTEHVRCVLGYDFEEFIQQIKSARERYDLVILSGCEAKVLPDGELDVPDKVLSAVDCPIFAIHGTVRDKQDLVHRIMKAIEHPAVNIWAHPGAGTAGTPLELGEEDVGAILRKMRRDDVALETNDRYGVPPPEWVHMAQELGVAMVRGSDSHSLSDLEASFRRYQAVKSP